MIDVKNNDKNSPYLAVDICGSLGHWILALNDEELRLVQKGQKVSDPRIVGNMGMAEIYDVRCYVITGADKIDKYYVPFDFGITKFRTFWCNCHECERIFGPFDIRISYADKCRRIMDNPSEHEDTARALKAIHSLYIMDQIKWEYDLLKTYEDRLVLPRTTADSDPPQSSRPA